MPTRCRFRSDESRVHCCAASVLTLDALRRGADPGDLSTLDDPQVLEEIRRALEQGLEQWS